MRIDRRPNRKSSLRPWKNVTGITLHQTATCFLQYGDTNEARLKRAIDRVCKISAHHVILRNGIDVWSNPYNYAASHAQWFNASDVGIEIDGWFAGVHGDIATFWKPASVTNRTPMELTQEQIDSTKDCIRHICAEVKANGGEIKYIHAHRQTSRKRISDPGSLIWQQIAIPMMEELDLHYGGPDFFVPTPDRAVVRGCSSSMGNGYPIPVEWDPTAKHRYRVDRTKINPAPHQP